MPSAYSAVTVVGLGPMGQAMVRTLLDHEVPVTVFNRTTTRGDELVSAGATRAATVTQALDASDLVIVSLTHYAAMYELLESSRARPAGKTIVNLSSDTPREADRAALWSREHGAELLVGGLMASAVQVGDESAYCFYSGSEKILGRHSDVLRLLARPEYVGEQPGLALLWYQAMLDVFMVSLASLTHATALVGSGGVTAARFVPYASKLLSELPFYLGDEAEQIDSRRYPDFGASVAMMAAGIDHITVASEDAGIDAGLPASVRALYQRAIALGHATDSSTSIYEAIVAANVDEDAA